VIFYNLLYLYLNIVIAGSWVTSV